MATSPHLTYDPIPSYLIRMGIKPLPGRNRAYLHPDGHVVMELTNGIYALLDYADWPGTCNEMRSSPPACCGMWIETPMVSLHRWSTLKCSSASKPIYNAAMMQNGKHVLLQRFLLGLAASSSKRVVRVNTAGVDCRRANLRVTDGECVSPRRKQDTYHGRPVTSKYLGVGLSSQRNKDGTTRCYWDVRVTYGGKQHYLGVFPNTKDGEIEAAKAYDAAVREHCAEGASTNFPEGCVICIQA